MTARPSLLPGEDLPPQPRQKRSLDKRSRLKTAALSLFGEVGYEGASIDEIASRAGLAVGGFYQHFRSKRQLLLALMDDLLEGLSRLDLGPSAAAGAGPKALLHAILSRAFHQDLSYLGAYRAWREAALSDPGLAQKQREIHAWTTARVLAVFELLQRFPGTRPHVDLPGLAAVMDSFFWSLLAQANQMSPADLNRSIDAATHLICHALFLDTALTN